MRIAFNSFVALAICVGIVSSAAARATGAESAGDQSAEKGSPGDAKSEDAASTTAKRAPKVRWKAAENNTWEWFAQETFADGQWKLTGITTPRHKFTGQFYDGASGYLELSAVPAEVRRRSATSELVSDAAENNEPGVADPIRKAREGRPASKWIRSLKAKELRAWLPTIDVPEAGVEGMTYWEHLTRDHGFDPALIDGLTEEEEAKLHAAAHAGY